MTELTNEQSLDMFADMLEPAAEILGDPALQGKFKSGTIAAAVAYAIKNHKQAVVKILAASEGKDPAAYKVNALTLPIKLLNLLNKPELKELFTWQGQKSGDAPSGSAMANTEENER